MDTEKSLSQSQIDALLSGDSEHQGGPEEATETIPTSSAPKASPPSDARASTSVTESMDAVAARQTEVSVLSKRSDHLETAVAETKAAIRDIQRNLQAVVENLQLLDSKIEGLRETSETPRPTVSKTALSALPVVAKDSLPFPSGAQNVDMRPRGDGRPSDNDVGSALECELVDDAGRMAPLRPTSTTLLFARGPGTGHTATGSQRVLSSDRGQLGHADEVVGGYDELSPHLVFGYTAVARRAGD